MEMEKKTNRKNNVGQEVKLIKDKYFTIQDLINYNLDMKKITLRTKLKKLIDNGIVQIIGDKMGGKGRPQSIMATTPISKTVYNKAVADDIRMVEENDNKLIHVTNINKQIPFETKFQEIVDKFNKEKCEKQLINNRRKL